jgi:uncharacterized membrane protein (DUF4010 family)
MDDLKTLGLSLGLGFLIGLQRQRSEKSLGGIRTFPLLSLLGTFCGLLALTHGGWIVGAGFLGVAGLIVASNLLKLNSADGQPGQTTEVAALATYAMGAYLVRGDVMVAVVAVGIIAVLLHLKGPLHIFAEKMGQQDMTAIMQLVVIAMVVYPVLPDRAYGPYEVLNPSDIWRMVVLIVGISLAGYVAYKLVGERAGTLLGGVFGGIVSSTATTVSYARRAKESAGVQGVAVVAVMIASVITYIRILVEVAVVAPKTLRIIAAPIAAMLGWMLLLSAVAYFRLRSNGEPAPAPKNPAQLTNALVFGGVYALVLFIVAAAQDRVGQGALYLISVISGLTNVDAMTLSAARLMRQEQLPLDHGWRLILVASLSNIVFKAAAAAALGGLAFGKKLGLYFAAGLAGGFAILFLWPA